MLGLVTLWVAAVCFCIVGNGRVLPRRLVVSSDAHSSSPGHKSHMASADLQTRAGIRVIDMDEIVKGHPNTQPFLCSDDSSMAARGLRTLTLGALEGSLEAQALWDLVGHFGWDQTSPGAENQTVVERHGDVDSHQYALLSRSAALGCSNGHPLLRFVHESRVGWRQTRDSGANILVVSLETVEATYLDIFERGRVRFAPRVAKGGEVGGEEAEGEENQKRRLFSLGSDASPRQTFSGPIAEVAYNLNRDEFDKRTDDVDMAGDILTLTRDSSLLFQDILEDSVDSLSPTRKQAAKARYSRREVSKDASIRVDLVDPYIRGGIGVEFEASWSLGRFDRLRFAFTVDGAMGIQSFAEILSSGQVKEVQGGRTRVLAPRKSTDDSVTAASLAAGDSETQHGSGNSSQRAFDPIDGRMQLLPEVRIDIGPIPMYVTPRGNAGALGRWLTEMRGSVLGRGMDAAFRARVGLDYDRRRTEGKFRPIWDVVDAPLRRRRGMPSLSSRGEDEGEETWRAELETELQLNLRADIWALAPLMASIRAQTWSTLESGPSTRDVGDEASGDSTETSPTTFPPLPQMHCASHEVREKLEWGMTGKALLPAPQDMFWSSNVDFIPGYLALYSKSSSGRKVLHLVDESGVNNLPRKKMLTRLGGAGQCLMKRALQRLCAPDDNRDPCATTAAQAANASSSSTAVESANRCVADFELVKRHTVWGESCTAASPSTPSTPLPALDTEEDCVPQWSVASATVLAIRGAPSLNRPIVKVEVRNSSLPWAGALDAPGVGLVAPLEIGTTSSGKLKNCDGCAPGTWLPQINGSETGAPVPLEEGGFEEGLVSFDPTSTTLTVRVIDITNRLFGTKKESFVAEIPSLPSSCPLDSSSALAKVATSCEVISIEGGDDPNSPPLFPSSTPTGGNIRLTLALPLLPSAEAGKKPPTPTEKEKLEMELVLVSRSGGSPSSCLATPSASRSSWGVEGLVSMKSGGEHANSGLLSVGLEVFPDSDTTVTLPRADASGSKGETQDGEACAVGDEEDEYRLQLECGLSESNSNGPCLAQVRSTPSFWIDEGTVVRTPVTFNPTLLREALRSEKSPVLRTTAHLFPANTLGKRVSGVESVLFEVDVEVEVEVDALEKVDGAAAVAANGTIPPVTFRLGHVKGISLDASPASCVLANDSVPRLAVNTFPTAFDDFHLPPMVPLAVDDDSQGARTGAANVPLSEIERPETSLGSIPRLLDALSPNARALEVRYADEGVSFSVARPKPDLSTTVSSNEAVAVQAQVLVHAKGVYGDEAADALARALRVTLVSRASTIERLIPGQEEEIFLPPGATRLFEVEMGTIGQVDAISVHVDSVFSSTEVEEGDGVADYCRSPPTLSISELPLFGEGEDGEVKPNATLRALQYLLRNAGYHRVIPTGFWDFVRTGPAVADIEGILDGVISESVWEAVCPGKYEQLFRAPTIGVGLLDGRTNLIADTAIVHWEGPMVVHRSDHPELFHNSRFLLRVVGAGDAWATMARLRIELVTSVRTGRPTGVWGMRPGERRLIHAIVPPHVVGGEVEIGISGFEGESGGGSESGFTPPPISATARLVPIRPDHATLSAPSAGREGGSSSSGASLTDSLFQYFPLPENEVLEEEGSGSSSSSSSAPRVSLPMIELVHSDPADETIAGKVAEEDDVLLPPPTLKHDAVIRRMSAAIDSSSLAIATGVNESDVGTGAAAVAVLLVVEVDPEAEASVVDQLTFSITIQAVAPLLPGPRTCTSASLSGGGVGLYAMSPPMSDAERERYGDGFAVLRVRPTQGDIGGSEPDAILVPIAATTDADAYLAALHAVRLANPRSPWGATFHVLSSTLQKKLKLTHELRDTISTAPRFEALGALAARLGLLPGIGSTSSMSKAPMTDAISTWVIGDDDGSDEISLPMKSVFGENLDRAAVLVVRERVGGAHCASLRYIEQPSRPTAPIERPAAPRTPLLSVSRSTFLLPSDSSAQRATVSFRPRAGTSPIGYMEASVLERGGGILEVELVAETWKKGVESIPKLVDFISSKMIRSASRSPDAKHDGAVGVWDRDAVPTLQSLARRGGSSRFVSLPTPSTLRLTLPPLPDLATSLRELEDALLLWDFDRHFDPSVNARRSVLFEALDLLVPSFLLAGQNATSFSQEGILWTGVEYDPETKDLWEVSSTSCPVKEFTTRSASIALSRARGELLLRELACSRLWPNAPAAKLLGYETEISELFGDPTFAFGGTSFLFCLKGGGRTKKILSQLQKCPEVDQGIAPGGGVLGDVLRPHFLPKRIPAKGSWKTSVYGLSVDPNRRSWLREAAASGDGGLGGYPNATLCTLPFLGHLGATLIEEAMCAAPEAFGRLDIGSPNNGIHLQGPARASPYLFAPAARALLAAAAELQRAGDDGLVISVTLRTFAEETIATAARKALESGYCDEGAGEGEGEGEEEEEEEPDHYPPSALCAVAERLSWEEHSCWAGSEEFTIRSAADTSASNGVVGSASVFTEGRGVVFAEPPSSTAVEILAQHGWVVDAGGYDGDWEVKNSTNSSVGASGGMGNSTMGIFVGFSRPGTRKASPAAPAAAPDGAPHASPVRFGVHRLVVVAFQNWWNKNLAWAAAPSLFTAEDSGVASASTSEFNEGWGGEGVESATLEGLEAEFQHRSPLGIGNPKGLKAKLSNIQAARVAETGIVDSGTVLRLLATPLVPQNTTSAFCRCNEDYVGMNVEKEEDEDLERDSLVEDVLAEHAATRCTLYQGESEGAEDESSSIPPPPSNLYTPLTSSRLKGLVNAANGKPVIAYKQPPAVIVYTTSLCADCAENEEALEALGERAQGIVRVILVPCEDGVGEKEACDAINVGPGSSYVAAISRQGTKTVWKEFGSTGVDEAVAWIEATSGITVPTEDPTEAIAGSSSTSSLALEQAYYDGVRDALRARACEAELWWNVGKYANGVSGFSGGLVLESSVCGQGGGAWCGE